MTKIKRILVLILALAMTLSFTACGDTSWITKVDDVTVNSGLYIYYQIQGYDAAGIELIKEDPSYQYFIQYGISYIDANVGEESVRDYMNSFALDMSKQYVIVDKLFTELNLELTEDDESLIKARTENEWKNLGTYFEKVGVSKKTVEKAQTSLIKEEKVFNTYYEVGGLNGTTEDDIKAYLSDNYVRVKYLSFRFADNVDDAIDEEEAEALETAQSYLDRANAGEDFDELIAEYEAELAKEAAGEDEEEEGGKDIDLPEEEPEETDETEDAEDDTEEDKEEDLYENEYIFFKESKRPSEKFINYLFESIKAGEVGLIQDDTHIYLVQKLDISERTDVYDENREFLLKELFDTDYTGLINEKLKSYTVEVNEKSVKRYKPDSALGIED